MIFIFLTAYVTLSKTVSSANILYVAPFPSLSHYQMMEPLMLSLAQRGHQITVLSHYPQANPVPNYTDISLRGTVTPSVINFASFEFFRNMITLFRMSAAQCEGVVSSPVVQDFLREDRRFDLLFLEIMASDCYLGFAKRYPVPYVLVNSQSLGAWLGDWVLNPTEAAYVPDVFCRVGGRLDFHGRLWNAACQGLLRMVNVFYNIPISVGLVRRYFHVDIDTLEDVKRNVSMIFVNSFPPYSGIRPVLPNVVELAGIHMKKPKPLPDKMKKFLDEATDGVIVFSAGSMVRSHTLDSNLRDVFVRVFRRIRQRVVWKWEAKLEDRPDNVMVVDWLPQSDALGHPNVRLFMSHGGNHGSIEALHYGVPVLGFPLYGDQKANLLNLEALGMAKIFSLENVTDHLLHSAIMEMLENKVYAENAQRLSRIMRDRPMPPLELAIFWTEHILRNGRTESATSHLLWYQHRQLDVIILCIFFIIIFICIMRLIVSCLLLFFRRRGLRSSGKKVQ